MQIDDDIAAYLPSLTDVDDVVRLLVFCVGRVLQKFKRTHGVWRAEAARLDLRHVAEWLEVDLARGEKWLSNVDGEGRPKKLLKFGDLDGIVSEADKATAKHAQNLAVVVLDPGHETEIYRFQDDWFIAKLLTPEALVEESRQMGHCVGLGQYDARLKSGKVEILSLRSPRNKAHVTIEIEVADNAVRQVRGKQNARPIAPYARKVREFLRASQFSLLDRAWEVGIVVDEMGEMHDIDRLPENLCVRGNLLIDDPSVRSLPTGLEVSGKLILRGASIAALPTKLKVGKGLDASESGLEELPKDHGISGSIDLSRSAITKLAEDIFIDGNLDISGTALKELPPGMIITGDLVAKKVELESLGERTVVGKNMVFSDSKVKCFDVESLYVGGTMQLSACGTVRMPQSLGVERSLILEGTTVEGQGRAEIGKNLFAYKAASPDRQIRFVTRGRVVDRRPASEMEMNRAFREPD